MINSLLQSPISFAIYAFGLILAISIHEFSHAITADRLGDPTPASQGRLTLNPLKHLDPLGSLALLLFGFGWGKPVEFDSYNLKSPRRDAAIISIAGPISNFLLAIIASILGRYLVPPTYFYAFIAPLIYTNIMLGVFNLVPVGPLDGQKILFGLLPRDLAYEFQSVMSRYGTMILLFLILPVFGTEAPITRLISPVIQTLASFLIPLV